MRGAPLLLLCVLLAGCAFAPPPGDAPTPTGATPTPSTTPAPPTPRAPQDAERVWNQLVPGYASPAFREPFRHPVLAEDAEGKVAFLGALENRTGRVVVHAMDAARGDLLWSHVGDLHRERVSDLVHHARDGLVLVAADATILALDARTGEPRWNRTLAPVGHVSSLDVAPDGAVLAAGLDLQGAFNTLTRGSRPYLASLDPATGVPHWNVREGLPAIGSPALSVAEDGSAVHLVIAQEVHPPGVFLRVSSHDLRDGSTLWSANAGTYHGLAVNLAHDPDNGTLFLTGRAGSDRITTSVLAISDVDGVPRWSAELPMEGLGALALSPNGTLVCAAGPLGVDVRVDCLRAADGRPVWNATRAPMHGDRRLAANGLAFSRDGGRLLLLVAGGSALHADGTPRGGGGEVMLAAYDPATGRPLWDKGWHRQDDLGTAAALLASRHAPRAYVAGEGGSIHRDRLTVDAVHLAR